MKGFLKFTKIWILALTLAAAAFAQTEIRQASPTAKIVYVNSEAFYDKESGITELVEIFEKLSAEFQPQYNELVALAKRIMALQEELEEYNKYYKFFKIAPEFVKKIEEKTAEYESLIDKYKTKEAVAKYLYERRAAVTIEPVKKKIARTAYIYAAEKGYVLILDISKSNGTFTFSVFDNSDVTADFINYYNEIYTKLKTQ